MTYKVAFFFLLDKINNNLNYEIPQLRDSRVIRFIVIFLNFDIFADFIGEINDA